LVRPLRTLNAGLLASALVACASTDRPPAADQDAGAGYAPEVDAAFPAGDASRGGTDTGTTPLPPGTTNIKHVVVIVQENHSFDAYFGRWCTAPAGSNPTCSSGPACCEAAPSTDPSGASPVVLDDAENATWDPNHSQTCELSEMNGGAMNRFVTGAPCSNANNFAIATDVVKPYQDWASQYAIADRYFQPLAGESTANDMYFAVAKYVFTDNAFQPNTNGHSCTVPPTPTTLYDGQTTIADLLIASGQSFAFYAEGYARMISAAVCPSAPADCPAKIPLPPCVYSPSDVPFEFYSQFSDNPTYMKDLDDLATDLGQASLPTLSFVKHVTYLNEHPGYNTTISQGVAAVQGTVGLILSSPYANDTLILVTWDEGGGFFDHVAPPPNNGADNKPYGTRVPLLALGRFAKKGYISHTVMEHSSILKFIEWNFLGNKTGQLNARDATVNGIGSLLDPAQVGVSVP
jgi:phospholipase C